MKYKNYHILNKIEKATICGALAMSYTNNPNAKEMRETMFWVNIFKE